MGVQTRTRPRGAWWWAGVTVLAVATLMAAAPARSATTCDGVPATIVGSTGDDVIDGTGGPDVIVSREGDDVIRGNGGDDLICAGSGDDAVFGGSGDDTIHASDGNDRIRGNAGNDVITGGDGKDRIGAGSGDDFIDGGRGNDRLVGGIGDDRILGEGGNDLIQGGAGNDRLEGGLGYNRMAGNDGNDHIIGGKRGEAIAGGLDGDRIYGNGGNDWIRGGGGHDLIHGGASTPAARVCDPFDPTVCHSDPRDILEGGAGEDRLVGGGGDDELKGQSGFDTLEGGPGDDLLVGGTDDDFLDGGPDDDIAHPGQGNDTCRDVEGANGSCDDAPSVTSLGAWRGSSDAKAISLRLLNVMVLQTACGDDARHLAQLEALVATAPSEVRADLRAAMAALRRSVQACNLDDAVWGGALSSTVGHLDRIADSSPAADPSDPLLAATTRASASVDIMTHWLSGNQRAFKVSALWLANQHYGKHLDMADEAAAGGFDLAMVGSSLVVNGFDAERFVAGDGRSAFNAGVFAMGPEAIQLWLPAVIRLATPDVIAYGVLPRDVFERHRVPGSCLDDVSAWAEVLSLQETVFAPVDAVDGIWWERLMFGDPMAAEPHPLYRAEFSELGTRLIASQSTIEQILASAEKGAWEGPFPQCPERYDFFAANIEAIAAAGIDPVVVFMPMSGYREGMFEGGRAEVEAILAQMEAVAFEAGAAAVIDLSESVPDDEFKDLAHVNRRGARRFTDALVERLSELGI